METALALSYALGDFPEDELIAAAKEGGLSTNDAVAMQVKRRFEKPPPRFGNSRVMDFSGSFHYPTQSSLQGQAGAWLLPTQDC